MPSHSPSRNSTPSTSSSPTPSDSDSDESMANLRERSIFFPQIKFDGRNKALTKQHWQAFEDFCEHQKLPIPATEPDPDDRDGGGAETTIDQILPFFKMTLTDLARAWLERQTFASPKDLKDKFLTDFSPYGKTHRQWIAQWADLKFNLDTDNIDEFIDKFEDLARLNELGTDYKLHTFKVAMPKEIELHLRSITDLEDCYKTAKELLTIVQNPITNKMSTLSLVHSRSPSPHSRPQSRSPSPRRPIQPSVDRSRTRTNPNRSEFNQYPQGNRPQSIMRRPFRNTITRGRGRSMRGRAFSRPRSLSRHRSFPDRCFNCNMVGHMARNCFTRTRPQSQNRFNFPKRFTPNFRKNQRRDNLRSQQRRVRFQDQYPNRYNEQYGNGYEYNEEYMGQYTDNSQIDQSQDQYPGYHLN